LMRQAHRLQLRGQPQLDRNNRSSVFPINPAKGAVISTVLSLPQSCQTNVGITVISAGLCAENATGSPPWLMIWPPNLLQLALPAIFPLVHIRSVYRPDRSNFDSPCSFLTRPHARRKICVRRQAVVVQCALSGRASVSTIDPDFLWNACGRQRRVNVPVSDPYPKWR
jgi:hypothetical protein